MLILTDNERQLFEFLKQVIREKNLDIVLRVAGGWVRDKIINCEESNDIDIAIDNMTGQKFIEYIGIHKTYLVPINHEKSKHLETVSAKLFGYNIDFVNLRSETYHNTRIPQIEFGTPEVDSFRRDITINSLFYNINTNNIEDFTGKGLDDIKNGIIRTPLQPLQTFADDPLRMLRVLRFSSKYNFTIDKGIEELFNSDVKLSLISKVSRERIGQEIGKMFNHKNALLSLQLLHKYSFCQTIFGECYCLQESLFSTNYINHSSYYYALLLFKSRSIYIDYNNQKTHYPYYAMNKLLKYSRLDSKNVSKILLTLDDFSNIILSMDLQRLILHLQYIKELWIVQLHLIGEKDIHSNIEKYIKENLDNCWKVKSILNGNEISQILKVEFGPIIKTVVDRVIEYQILHPEATKDEIVVWIKRIHW